MAFKSTSRAFNKIAHGDMSSNPTIERWIEYVLELHSDGALNTKSWTTITAKDGNVFIHRQFLEIQDKLALLSPELNTSWNSTVAIKALIKYLPIKRQARLLHLKIFKKACERLTKEEREVIDEVISDIGLMRLDVPRVLVCIPYYSDNKSLWARSGLTHGMISRIPTYAKIHEAGLIFASKRCRNKYYRRHDYFSYAAEEVSKGSTASITDKLLETARHEGCHGPLDELIPYLLGLSDVCTIPEGIAGSLGNDGRDRRYTNIDLRKFVNSPCDFINDTHKHTLNYTCAPKFFTSIIREVETRNACTKNEAWVILFLSCLKTTIKLSKKREFQTYYESKKTSLFYKNLLAELDLSLKTVNRHYKKLNQHD